MFISPLIVRVIILLLTTIITINAQAKFPFRIKSVSTYILSGGPYDSGTDVP